MQLSCPYCNAGVSLAEAPPTGRAVCPRCGEAFPVRTPVGDDEPRPPVAPQWSVSGEGPPGRSLRSPALLGAALGLIILGVGLYAVYRRPGGRPTDPTGPGAAKSTATVPPAALAGLAYLPAETTVAFAVQPGPLVAHAGRTQADPRAALAASGVPDRVLAALDRLGLKPEQIDHIVGGLTLTGNQPLKVVVVLVLREPLTDRSDFLKRLRAIQTTAASGQVRYGADLGGVAMTMTNPDPRTYLFALDPADLEPPARTGPPGAHLPAGLRESLARLSPASVAWAATDADDWSANPALKVVAALAKRPDLPARLAGVRAVAVGVSLEPELRLTAAVRATSPDAASKLKARVTDTLADRADLQVRSEGAWVTVEGPPAADAWAGLESLLPKPAEK
ncbi:MAG TPA: hypothetical protein VFG68_09960 [Fimbriiglobus sp.]|nr:hypothetical protein [Fimbriiglobus sp.]